MKIIKRFKSQEMAEYILKSADQMNCAAWYELGNRKWYIVTIEGSKTILKILLLHIKVKFAK